VAEGKTSDEPRVTSDERRIFVDFSHNPDDNTVNHRGMSSFDPNRKLRLNTENFGF
jgi:hypothetical protein